MYILILLQSEKPIITNVMDYGRLTLVYSLTHVREFASGFHGTAACSIARLRRFVRVDVGVVMELLQYRVRALQFISWPRAQGVDGNACGGRGLWD